MAKERKPDDAIPTGRARRTAKMGALVGGQAARSYAGRAAGAFRSADGREAASARRQADAAEQIVEVLGQMKGAAMKIGQVASFIDLGGMSPEAQERIQAKLAELRDSAPRVGFREMRRVLEEELGQRVGEVFAEFDEEAVAAASIGQVYRARLHDGRPVAVKVQYPGVAQAVRADLSNLPLILRAAKRMAPGIDAQAMANEIRERLTEELDYEHESQNHRAFARAWRNHPFVVIPEVLTELSSERVLVTEYVEGMGFEEVKELSQAERDRFGEIVFRFFSGSLYRQALFSGDPHPGNFMLLADGRVAFLDFGMARRVDWAYVDAERGAVRAGFDGDAETLHARLSALGYFPADDPVITPERLLAHFKAISDWLYRDREVALDPAYVGRHMVDMGDPRSQFWDLMRRQTVPPKAMLARRMEALVLGVLGQLRASANWHAISREWLFDDPPSTPLGEAEAEFFAARSAPRAA